MSAKDPDVRSELESTLLDQIARSKERIVLLEAQLASAQKSLPAERADVSQTPAPPPLRPPISMSAFNNNLAGNNLSGPSTEAVAATVRAAANARNAPAPFPSLSDASHDNFEPTARLDAGELRRAHRALNRSRANTYRRVGVGLLCLACGALWAGVWQMRAGARHSQRPDALQILAVAAPAANAYGVPPIPVPLASVSPLPASASEQHEAGILSVVAGTMNGKTMVEPDAPPRVASAPHFPARVPLPISAPRHAQTIAADFRQGAGNAETHSYSRSATVRNLTSSLPPVILPAETSMLRRKLNRTALAGAHLAGLKHSSAPSAHLIVHMQRRTVAFKPEPRSAVVSAPIPNARSNYGLGSGRSESSEEQIEEQAEAVHGWRAAAYDRDDRRNDIEANVDHAIQTLDKMKELLDGMEHRRKSPVHP